MKGTYHSPCVGCRHAAWYEHAPDFGQCEHPAMAAYRDRPMVLLNDDTSTGSIMRRQFSRSYPGQCKAREDA